MESKPPVLFSTPGQLRRSVPRAIIRGMKPTNPLLATSALLVAMAFPLCARAQTTTPPLSCTASSDAAVQCFVANAVTTGLTTPRYGMTLAQFQDYGVAVTKILQTDQTYLVLVGLSSAIADALPPKNADGTFNSGAQETAIAQIVAAAATDGFVWPPSGTDLQDLQWFTQDLVNAMNVNQQVLQILTPGVTLRIIDSYVITGHRLGRHRKLAAGQFQPDHAGRQLHLLRPGASDAFAHHRAAHGVRHRARANHRHLQSCHQPRRAVIICATQRYKFKMSASDIRL